MANSELKIIYTPQMTIHRDPAFQLPESYFVSIQDQCAQAYISELMNFQQYNRSRNVTQIKRHLKSLHKEPFMFINCLN